MFGYIVIDQPEMKFKDYDIYQGYYCGLCRSLKKKYGRAGQMSLNYDLTFLLILLTGLYEPSEQRSNRRCGLHPFSHRGMIQNEISEYAADMTILLSYNKCKDDWKDEKKVVKHLYGNILTHSYTSVKDKYPEKVRRIEEYLKEIETMEKEDSCSLDHIAGAFGKVMGEIFCWKKDQWTQHLYEMGFYLGKFIYLMDAYDDLEKDKENNTFNPFKAYEKQDNFETFCFDILKMMMAECSKRFEYMPILLHQDILRNILYAGVWSRYKSLKRKEEEKKPL